MLTKATPKKQKNINKNLKELQTQENPVQKPVQLKKITPQQECQVVCYFSFLLLWLRLGNLEELIMIQHNSASIFKYLKNSYETYCKVYKQTPWPVDGENGAAFLDWLDEVS